MNFSLFPEQGSAMLTVKNPELFAFFKKIFIVHKKSGLDLAPGFKILKAGFHFEIVRFSGQRLKNRK